MDVFVVVYSEAGDDNATAHAIGVYRTEERAERRLDEKIQDMQQEGFRVTFDQQTSGAYLKRCVYLTNDKTGLVCKIGIWLEALEN